MKNKMMIKMLYSIWNRSVVLILYYLVITEDKIVKEMQTYILVKLWTHFSVLSVMITWKIVPVFVPTYTPSLLDY